MNILYIKKRRSIQLLVLIGGSKSTPPAINHWLYTGATATGYLKHRAGLPVRRHDD